jgi:hypothetical protein
MVNHAIPGRKCHSTMSDSIQDVVLRELQLLLEPIVKATSSEYYRTRLLKQCGWDLQAISGFPVARLQAKLQEVVEGYTAVVAAVDDPPDTLNELIDLLKKTRNAFIALRGLPSVIEGAGSAPPPEFDKLGEDLLTLLVISYLQQHHAVAYRSAVLLTLIVPPEEAEGRPAVVSGTAIVRRSQRRGQLRLNRIGDLIKNPTSVLSKEYFDPTKPLTAAEANAAADRLMPRLAHLLKAMGLEATYGIDPDFAAQLGPGAERAARLLTARYGSPSGDWDAGVTLGISGQETGGLGLVMAPFGTLAFSEDIGGWHFSASATASPGAVSYGPSGVTVIAADGRGMSRIETQLDAYKLPNPDSGIAILIGDQKGSHLEIAALQLSLKLTAADNGRFEFGCLADVDKASIVVAAPSGDGFLGKILPPNGLRTEFDLGIGWATGRGLFLKGSAGLDASLPVNISLGGVIEVDTIRLGLRASDQGLQLICEMDPSIALGPVAASIRGLGLEADIAFPEGGGNIGPADLGLGIKPPTGAGLAIDAGGVSGGGFLDYYKPEQRYAGILTLNFGEIGLTAVGLITTKLPGGKKGFAMLLIIGVEFSPPIQLSFGFTLSGVGGLIGINRTMVVDVLRAGLKSHTLDSILFPENPILNAAKIISDLSAVFPPEEGRFLIGPMIKIGWGSPNVIEADIGILIELPEPVRLVILGAISATFPNKKNPKIELHLDVLGVIEFAKKSLAIDATLYDSRLLSYPLSGDAALRLTWGDNPQFAMSVGGFHPRFKPPRGFPELRRMKLDLSQSGSFSLVCTAYQALTSNSLQFGARVDLYAEAAGASLDGSLSFDALIYFSPFAFDIDISGRVVARYKGHRLAGVSLHLSLSGPNPWHAKGKATFEILCWDVDARFNRTWGSDRKARLDPVNAWTAFRAEIRRKESWGAVLPGVLSPGDALRPVADPSLPILVHPAGTLEVRQRLLPLNVKLDTLGNAPVTGLRTFRLGAFVAGQGTTFTDLQPKPIEDFFARGQYEELSDKKKVSLPSFEKMQAGVVAGGPPLRADGQAQDCPVTYESIVINKEGASSPAKKAGRIPMDVAQRLAKGNAVSRARKFGASRFRIPGVSPKVSVQEESYRLADAVNLAAPAAATGVPSANGRLTRMQADQILAGHVAAHPELNGKLAVIAGSEVP